MPQPTTASMLQQLKTLPNLLSSLRLALVPVFLLLLLSNNQLWSIIVLTFSGITDFLDGFLARKLKAESRFGAIFDTMTDIIVYLIYPAVIFFSSFRMDNIIGVSFIYLFILVSM